MVQSKIVALYYLSYYNNTPFLSQFQYSKHVRLLQHHLTKENETPWFDLLDIQLEGTTCIYLYFYIALRMVNLPEKSNILAEEITAC